MSQPRMAPSEQATTIAVTDPGRAGRRRVAVWTREPLEAWQTRAIAALAQVADVTLGTLGPASIGGSDEDIIVELGLEWPRPTTATVLVLRDEDDLGPERIGAKAFSAGRHSVVVRLMVVRPDGSGGVLEEGALPLNSWKWPDARRSLMKAVADWPARALARGPTLAASGCRSLTLGAAPGRWQMRKGQLSAIGNRIASWFVDERWALGVVDYPLPDLVDDMPGPRVRWLEPPPGEFLADPMVLPSHGPSAVVLAEAYPFRERRGRIIAIDIGRDCRATKTVLDLPWHLSYPFLFRHGGDIFCLPEMHEARRAQLFRADPFPDRWVEGPVLLEDFPAVDATLYHDGERFWLFCTSQDDLPNAKLHLFHSEHLDTGWRPHPGNPVRCDLRNSRPAGPLFGHGGALWRPTQDCSITYGGAIVFNRVLELSPTSFREEAVARLEPDSTGPYPHGLHTICAAGDVTMIDGKRRFLTLRRLPAVLREYSRRCNW